MIRDLFGYILDVVVAFVLMIIYLILLAVQITSVVGAAISLVVCVALVFSSASMSLCGYFFVTAVLICPIVFIVSRCIEYRLMQFTF